MYNEANVQCALNFNSFSFEMVGKITKWKRNMLSCDRSVCMNLFICRCTLSLSLSRSAISHIVYVPFLRMQACNLATIISLRSHTHTHIFQLTVRANCGVAFEWRTPFHIRLLCMPIACTSFFAFELCARG